MPTATSRDLTSLGQRGDAPDGDPAHPFADLGRVGVVEPDDPEAPLSEPVVVCEGRTEVAHSDDHHGPVLGQPERPADASGQFVDVIPDSSYAEGS